MVEITPGGAGIGARGLAHRINTYRAHRCHVDDQAIVVGAESGCAVPAVANGEVQSVVLSEVDRGDDVSYLLGAKHGQRTLVKHAVVHGARLVVTLVISSYHAASYLLAQVLDVDSRYRPLDLSVCHCSCLPALCKSSLKPAAAARAFRSGFRPDPVPPSSYSIR